METVLVLFVPWFLLAYAVGFYAERLNRGGALGRLLPSAFSGRRLPTSLWTFQGAKGSRGT